MKRRRDTENDTEIRYAIGELSMILIKVSKSDLDHDHDHDQDQDHVQSTDDHCSVSDMIIPTKPFLSVCTLILQVLDKIGPTMAVLRLDMEQNIQKLEKKLESEPLLYSNLTELLKMEATEKIAKENTSCSRALLWLTRSLDFSIALLQLLVKDMKTNIDEAVEEAYTLTLKPWHGWISSTAYRIAIKLVPDNETLIDILSSKGGDRDLLKEEMKSYISLLSPFLEQIHSVLV
ncbi:glycolipid transfer protein 3-like [Impatiens glandulifera]|uniref:glycolipid transfer protein 3-like n=1 Tax=Impatiens glandulifera TaxID=253017 RepID=UPI001FB12864|nr:glycolipid transfer protein 3-like [Impatiens glandulifera]